MDQSTKQPQVKKTRAAVKPKYQPKKGEEKMVHIKMEQEQFVPGTDQRVSKPQVMQFSPKDLADRLKFLPGQGWTLHEILHAPKEGWKVYYNWELKGIEAEIKSLKVKKANPLIERKEAKGLDSKITALEKKADELDAKIEKL